MSIDPDRFRRPSAGGSPPQPSRPRPLTDVSAPYRQTAPPVSQATPEPEPVLPKPKSEHTSGYVEQSAPAPMPRQAAPVIPPARQQRGDTNVTINISMPKFKKPTLPDWPWKRIRKYAIIIGVLILVSIVARLAIGFAVEQYRQNELKNRLDQVEQRTQPTYKPLTPAGRTASVTQNASFDGKRDSYSYNDPYKGWGLVVSQQPMPTEGSSKMASIAKSMNATTPLTITGGSAYVATDKASNGQMVIASKRGMLIFVQSPFTRSSDDWKQYLDNLTT